MFNARIAFIATAALALSARFAQADAETDHRQALDQEATGLGNYVGAIDSMLEQDVDEGTAMDHFDDTHCTDIIAAHKDLVTDADKLQNWQLKTWPGAVKAERGNAYVVPASEAPKICAKYKEVSVLVAKFAGHHLGDDVESTSGLPHVEDYNRSMIAPNGGAGEKCVADVKEAIADGAPHDLPVVMHGEQMTLDQLSARCVKFSADYAAAVAQIRAKIDAENAKISDVYRKVGIKGDRLELFVDAGMPEDSGFYFAGCDSGPTTAAQIKKAKKLFVWLGGENDPVTLRKYTFKGDKYTVAERTFDFKESAYAWCR